MKETTRNNIVRHVVSAAFVSTVLLGSLISIGLDWLTDKTGWPILPSFCIICFVYLFWRPGKGITVSDNEEQVVKLEPSKDLEEAASQYPSVIRTISPQWVAEIERAFIAGAKWQEEQIMKDAIERDVKKDAGGYPYIDATELYDYDNDKPLAKAGDKIKVVFIKE